MPATKTPFRLPEQRTSAQLPTGRQACPFLLKYMAGCGPDGGDGEPRFGKVPVRGLGPGASGARDPGRLSAREIEQVQPHRPTHCGHSLVVGRQANPLTTGAQEIAGRQVQRVKSANGSRKRCQSAVKHCRCQLYQRNSAEDFACRLTVSLVQMASMNPGPRLILKQPACDERFFPDRIGGSAILGQEVSEDYGCVDVDHRSLRSPASSLRISLSGATGAGGDGTSPGGSAGGEIHPCRTASASIASAKSSAPRCPRRPDLRNDSGAVGDQNRVPRSRQPHILAQATIESFDADSPHALIVATGSDFVNSHRLSVTDWWRLGKCRRRWRAK